MLYVSPLKALSNDVHKNLEIPLAGIAELARADGTALPEIRVAVRTGDTPVAERALMTRKAPHILVTTPGVLLHSADCGEVAEDAALGADADRGRDSCGGGVEARLASGVVDRAAGGAGRGPLQKIGLSATVSPIEEVARFLSERAHIIQVGHRREMDLAVEVPRDELGAGREQRDVDGDLRPHGGAGGGASHHAGVRQHAAAVGTGRASLGERLGEAAVLPHHGSLVAAICASKRSSG